MGFTPWAGSINFPGAAQWNQSIPSNIVDVTALVIPLDNTPNRTLEITVNVDGQSLDLRLTFRYNEIAQYWTMAIADPATGNILIDSIPLVTGGFPAANLLAQYAYLGLGSCYLVPMGGSSLDYPDDNSLGSYFCIVWGDSTNVLYASLGVL